MDAAVLPMKRWRVWMVLTLIAFLIVGHAVDVFAKREDWPFSYYPMYARVEKKKRLEMYSLFGLLRAPGYRALARITDPKYVPPLGESRLRVILMGAYRRGDQPQNTEDARQVMRDYLRLYESRRVAGLHDGPPMTEIYLYRLTWKLRPDGTPESHPWKSEPLLKVSRDELTQPSRPPTVLPPPTGPDEP